MENGKENGKGRHTERSNKIGLFINRMSEVVLSFPFKDCILEGGMTKEEKNGGREERFFCEEIDGYEIDTLKDRKVLTNFSTIDSKGEKKAKDTEGVDFFDKQGNLKNNLLIKGNNLLTLYSMKETFGGKVKMIYIDPPYNTSGDKNTFTYNNSFNHSTWLTFMKNRLEAARDLLRDDGVIFISIDDNEQAYLKILCDEIFGRDNFVANIIWEKKYSPQNDARWLSDTHDHVLLYSKNKEVWQPNLLPRTEEMDGRYKNPDNDPRGLWKSGDLSVKTYSAAMDYPIRTPSKRTVRPPASRCWRFSKKKFEELRVDNRIWFGEKGNNVPSLKRFLSEVKQGLVSKTIWYRAEVGDNQEAKQEIKNLFKGSDTLFDTPKPTRLIKRMLQLATDDNDIILDFFAGSGTTGHATLALNAEDGGNRKFILCEQIDEHFDICKERLQKVLKQSGKLLAKPSKEKVIAFELKQYNQIFLDKIKKAKTKRELGEVYKSMQKNAFLQFWFEKKEFEKNGYKKKEVNEQKEELLGILDLNQLYLNYPEMEDVTYKVAKIDQDLTHKFYANT
ncbi:MAG: site-specific DNA-methyltransferase [Candidatus Kaiserbacteria bacterium]|nr:site-specific DNA-methyltransferase [Candidatus Kaiserbacteria bacterium]